MQWDVYIYLLQLFCVAMLLCIFIQINFLRMFPIGKSILLLQQKIRWGRAGLRKRSGHFRSSTKNRWRRVPTIFRWPWSTRPAWRAGASRQQLFSSFLAKAFPLARSSPSLFSTQNNYLLGRKKIFFSLVLPTNAFVFFSSSMANEV